MCWDKDDDVLKVWNGSSYTSVSTPAGSFAVNTGDTFAGANTFTGTVNLTTSAPAMGAGADADAELVRMDRSATDVIMKWDESASALEFDFDGVADDKADVTITTNQIRAPLAVFGDGTGGGDITITFDDDDIDAAFTWDESAGVFEFDFDGVQDDKNDVTISTNIVRAPQIIVGIGTASDISLTFDNDDADPTFIWDDSANVIAITDASLKHAACSATEAATTTVDACDVVTITGTGNPVFTLNTCGTSQQGRILYVVCGADASILDDTGGNLQLAGDFTCTPDDVLTLICEGTTGDWLEVTRSAN
jgi:hypothetical protein